MGTRLEEFIEITRMKKGEFAAALGVNPSQLSRYLGKDGQMPQRDVLERLAALGCNLHWLITGEGGKLAPNEAGAALGKELYALGSDHAPKLLRGTDEVMQMRVVRSEDLEALETLIAKMKHSSV